MPKQPVTIIGGGIAGCLAAWSAHQAGHAVILYESKSLGSGASGQALGVLVPTTSTRRPIDDLQRQGCALWPNLIAELSSATGTDAAQLYRTWPNGAQLNISMLFQTFGVLFERLGITVIPSSAPHPSSKNLQGPTLWAAGWGNHKIAAGMSIRAGMACRLAPCGLDELLIGRGHPVQGLYAVPAWDGTTLLGTLNINMPEPYTGEPKPEWLTELRETAAQLYAPLATAPLLEVWVGNRPLSTPRLPLLQPVAQNQWAVAGMGGIGYALAPIVAKTWIELLPTT